MPVQKVSSAYVAGVGMTAFVSPKGRRQYYSFGQEAAVKALIDAGITYDDVEQGIGAWVYGDSCSAQRCFYTLGMTGIPIYNVNSYCSSGSTGLFMARQMIENGSADCVLVIGQEQMFPGALPTIYKDRENSLGRILDMSKQEFAFSDKGPWSPQLYANAQKEYLERYGAQGATAEDFGRITEINRRHGVNNPYSQLKKAVSLQEVMGSPVISGSVTRLQCCPSSNGAAATVLVSEKFLQSHPYLREQAIEIVGQALTTDSPKLFSKSAIELIGSDMTRTAAKKALAQAGITINDVGAIELHDCFTTNEMCALEGLGVAEEGKAWDLVRKGGITYGGKVVVNPSGGLISKGHPLGGTGPAQCAELCWHLRGWTDNRSVPGGIKYALQHNMGLGGATVVTIYARPDRSSAPTYQAGAWDGRQRAGYNPAMEARPITREMLESVRSKSFSEWMDQDESKVQAHL